MENYCADRDAEFALNAEKVEYYEDWKTFGTQDELQEQSQEDNSREE